MKMLLYATMILAVFAVNSPCIAQEPPIHKFKVGVITPLSGALAEYGTAAKNGIEMARQQNPALFSNIEFIYEDSQWIAKTAVSAFNKLRTLEQVDLVLNWGNPTTEAVAPLAERYRMPLIGMTLDPKAALGKKYVIRSTNASAHFSELLANYLTGVNYKQLGVIIAQNTYVEGLYDGLRAALATGVSLEVIDQYNHQDQDFRTSVSKISRSDYDAIGVFLISGQVSSFYRQLSAQGVALPTFGTDFFESATEIRNAGGGMDGAVYPHLGVTSQFSAGYIKQYGNDHQIAYAGNWHDMAIMIGELFNAGDGPDPDEIMRRLRGDRVYAGVGGRFQFKETAVDGPYYHFPVQLKRIKGQAIVPLTDY